MICEFWRLSEAGGNNLGLACTDDGLLLGRTPLIERRDERFIVREQHEIERLLRRAYQADLVADRLMPGLATVAAALNANDPCLARIAAVHLRIPDLPDQAARDDIEAEDILLKSADWNPALHPRTGTPPNPGWFAPTGGSNDESSPIRAALNDDSTQQADASPNVGDDWVRLPPGQYIDELHDFLEWLANAKPEDEGVIRAEIKRYYYDVGDTFGGDTLNHVLSDAIEAGTDKEWRQDLLNSIDAYAKTDPAEMGLMQGVIPASILAIPSMALEIRELVPEITEEAPAARDGILQTSGASSTPAMDPWSVGWAARGRYLEDLFGRTLHPNFPIIDKFSEGIATSIKSIDLNAVTYQDPARLIYRLNDYVNDLAEFDGAEWAGDEVKSSAITGRALSLAIPRGSMTTVQREAIEALRMQAKRMDKSVDIIITEF